MRVSFSFSTYKAVNLTSAARGLRRVKCSEDGKLWSVARAP